MEILHVETSTIHHIKKMKDRSHIVISEDSLKALNKIHMNLTRPTPDIEAIDS